jgi:hypothetical protein
MAVGGECARAFVQRRILMAGLDPWASTLSERMLGASTTAWMRGSPPGLMATVRRQRNPGARMDDLWLVLVKAALGSARRGRSTVRVNSASARPQIAFAIAVMRSR